MTDRWPRSLFAQGEEPDPRFTLANERTFLAWISTGLALLSVGVGMASLATTLNPHSRHLASVLLVLTGTACPLLAWSRWWRTEAALRGGRELPASPASFVVVASVAIAGIIVAVGLVLP